MIPDPHKTNHPVNRMATRGFSLIESTLLIVIALMTLGAACIEIFRIYQN